MPVAWEKFEVVYHYMDTIYEIEVKKAKKDTIIVDGKSSDGNYFKLVNDGQNHKVVVHVRQEIFPIFLYKQTYLGQTRIEEEKYEL